MACRLVCLKVYKGQWCILLAVSTLLWMLTLFNINSSNVVGSDRIKDEVIQLSERYIRTLARDSEGVVDGPYAGRFTAYDLKKTMAVLLENMIERLDRIEHRLNISSNLTKPSLSGDISMTHSLYAKDLINGEHELCALTDKERQLYPKCEQKIEWMKNMWQSDPCYASFGVDGSTCSFIMFLSEVEGWCPRSAWHGSNKAPVEKNSSDNLAKINHDLEGLMKLLVDPNERQGYAWMRMRIKRIWPRWETAVKSLAAKQDLTKRKQKKILVHLGLLSKQSGWKFAEMQFKGGPLGELVQWSDLITALYVLGHELTITSEVEQLANFHVNYTSKSNLKDLDKDPDKDLDKDPDKDPDRESNASTDYSNATMSTEQPTIENEYLNAAEAATERVASIIGNDFDCTDLFCQMDMLRPYKNDMVWKEVARWIRYEEAVEEGGERWSKPHVASLMMEALQDLQSILSTCPMLLDLNATSMAEIAVDVTNQWAAEGDISLFMKGKLCSLLTKQHKFQHYEKKKKPGASSNNLQKFFQEAHINKLFLKARGDSYRVKAYDNNDANHLSPDKPGLPRVASTSPDSPSLALGEMNKSFKRKIPPGSQVVNLLVGEVPELPKIIAAFVRLNDACNVGDITEVDLDTKFMFIIIGTKTHLGHCAEMCRCMATLFTDEFFRIVAFRCKSRQDLLAGIQEFNLHLTVLPPGVWDSSTRIEPPDEKPSQEYRKAGTLPKSMSNVSMVDLDKGMNGDIPGEGEGHNDPTLIRTGRIFGGLINDIKRKLPWYLSDYKDALHIQCVASFFFLFLATLTPNVTFGGLLTQATDDYMGTMECILAAAISGVLFALFSGQPLNILGSTGPMLVLEGILFRFCKDQDWDFMPFRVWVGFWTAFFIFLIVAFDLSALVRYITRFTEESFACLIALIFIVEAFKKTIEIEKDVPVHFRPPTDTLGCFCLLGNETGGEAQLNFTTTTTLVTETTTAAVVSSTSFLGNFSNITNVTTVSNVTTTAEPLSAFAQQCMDLGGLLQGPCDQKYVPDAFFFSLVLFFGTYILATALVHFRHSLFFPSIVRTNVSDFAVLISIVIMVVIDASLGLPTPKLTVPTEFKPTKPGRPWFINPISEKNPWWLMLFSAVPALLATILIFMDQQITAVIVNRSENKLKKGSGYHLDMLIVGVLVIILALFGLPWYVAATVTALAHVMSLKKVSETTAPGEKPTFLGVREQRVTALLVGIFSGLAVLFTSVLRYIPMPVLYGVFLYMGVAPLGGMQLIQRLMIIFMPAKYQPDHSFIRNVPLKRVHLFTFIQVVCLAILWVVKSVKSISIAFPLMVLLICFVRKALDKVFTQRELKWLDDILPATFVKKEEAEIQPVDGSKVKITIDSGDDDDEKTARRTVSNPETETDGKTENGLPSRLALESRKSLTFICKTDIDRIKAMTPEVITDRRKSLIYAAERKKSLASMDGDHKKFSPPSHVFGRKLSCEAYSPHFSPLPLFGGNAGHLEDPHNKLNRMLSLPATITDENEADSDSASSKSINSTKN